MRIAASRRGLLRSRLCGFTLLELLVVVLIIGLLTAVVAPRFLGQVSKSEVTAARAQMDAVDKALQAYRFDNGHFPSTEQGLPAWTTPTLPRLRPPSEPSWKR